MSRTRSHKYAGWIIVISDGVIAEEKLLSCPAIELRVRKHLEKTLFAMFVRVSVTVIIG